MANMYCKMTARFAFIALFTTGLLGLISPITAAQTISVGQQAAQNQNINKPKEGMSKSLVQRMFGKPISISKPVGKPPISRWHYEYFTVYFEGNYVIHSVLNRVDQSTHSSK